MELSHEVSPVGASKAIDQTEQALRNLVAHREALLEAERKRIAQEIHDEFGQLLNTLHVSNAALRAMLETEREELREKSDAMAILIRRTIDGLRNVATRLRPAALDAGIVCALEWLVQEFDTHTGLKCRLRLVPENLEPALSEAQALALFRIAQGSLTNVTRHASARSATVLLRGCRQKVVLEVRDDGKGFSLDSGIDRASLGLLGMRERATAIGGHLDISSRPGQGTCIRITLVQDETGALLND